MELRITKRWGLTIGLTVVGGIVGIMALLSIRSFFINRATGQAHARFMVQAEAHKKLMKDGGDAQDLIAQLHADAARFSSTAYGPYFLALASDLMAGNNDVNGAREVLGKALKNMSTGAPGLYYLYATHYALMQLDAEDPHLQVVGKQALEKLAKTAKNPHKDMALFYLGNRALLEQDAPAMEAAWRELFDQGRPVSHWGVRAQALINYTA